MLLIKKISRVRFCMLVIAMFLFGNIVTAQLTLPANPPYTQDFDALPTIPTGWAVRTGATTSALGTISTIATDTWGNSAGNFRAVAAAEAPQTTASSTAVQNAATDRALAVKPTNAFGDPGAAFTLQIANTSGKTSFSLSLKHMTFDNQTKTTTYIVEYSTVATGNSGWTSLGTYTTTVWGATPATYSFGAAFDNISTNVWIRIRSQTATGSGSQDTYGIDDVNLSWTNSLPPDINITSPNPAAPAASNQQGSTNRLLYRADVTIATSAATLTAATFTTFGGYAASDITNFKLWYQTTSTFTGSGTLLGTKITGLGPGAQAFGTLSQVLPIGTGYLFLTADFACMAVTTNSFNVAAVGVADFSFSSGNKTATPAPSAGGLQTISNATPVDVTGAAAATGNSQLTISWTNPGCFDEIMVLATDNASGITSVPTGNGSLYTASAAYNDGTNSPNLNPNEFCIYRGLASSVVMTNLINGTLYKIKIFTRKGTTWSAGVTTSGTPAAVVAGAFRSVQNGPWNINTTWQKFTSTWVAAGANEFPNDTATDVQIRNIVTLNTSGYAVRNLVVDPGAQLYANNTGSNRYINTYGNITCNGTMGNFPSLDDISFNMEGSTCLLTGTGTFTCSRIRKNTGTKSAGTLTIDMNINLTWGGTEIYNNYTGGPNTFNIIINSAKTVTGGTGGGVAIDGTNGAAFGSSYGNFTVNGTLILPGTLYLTTNNIAPYNCVFTIGSTGTVNAAAVSMAASTSTATSTLSIAAGGRLNITGTAGVAPFSATNNIYTLSAGSTVEYSALGATTVESGLPYSNLIISGSGTKTVNGNVSVGNIFTLTSGTYSQAAAIPLTTTIATGGTMTGNGGNFITGASGGKLSFAGNGTINGSTPLTFSNLNINAGTVLNTLNNCVADTLNLTGGIFSIGAANQFNISNGGYVKAIAGDFSTGVNGGILNFQGGGLFSGSCNPYNVYASGGVDFGSGTVMIQGGGSFRINANGYANTNGCFYATNSTLVYNNGSTFGAGTEWYASFPSGRGVPFNVQIGTATVNNTKVDFGSSNASRQLNGSLFIGPASGGANYGLILSTVYGGDLLIGGNWTRATTGTFTHNTRAVTFVGSAPSTVTVLGSGTETFAYLIINKAAAQSVIQSSTPATNITVTGSGGSNILQLQSGNLDLNQQTFNFTSYNGAQNNLGIDGTSGNLTRNVISTGGTGIFAVYNSDAVTHTMLINRLTANAALLVFGPTVTVTTGGIGSGGGGMNFGSGLTTIDGTLQINSYGFVNGFAPTYGNNSFLVYNSSGIFDRNVEWGAISGAGYPWNVVVQNNTSLRLNFPNLNGNGDRAIAGNLSIVNGSSLLLSTNVGNKLTVGANLVLDGTLTLPTTIGGDLYIARNFNRTSNGVFVPNDRAVFFYGSGNSTITASGGQLFPYLFLAKTNISQTLTLLDSISISKQLNIFAGTFDPAAKNATLLSNATGTASFGKVGVFGDVAYSGIGRFYVERYIPTGTLPGQHLKSWQLLSIPDNGGQTINQGWQEGHVLPVIGVSGYGTIISNNTAGAGFDIVGGSGPSMKSFVPSTTSWIGVPNTASTPLFNKKGYFILVRGDRNISAYNVPANTTTLRSAGKLFVPSNPPLTTTVAAGQFESIGNPYASEIDFLNITRPAAPAIDSVFYVWDPLLYGSYNLGGFQTISSVNGYKPTPGGTANYSSATAYTKIQSGQAFLVHATGGGSISFTENAKTSGSDLVYRSPAATAAGGRQYFRSTLYTSGGVIADATVLAFDQSFSNAFESNDAIKVLNAGENFGISSNAQIFSVEARHTIMRTDSIHYTLSNLRAQTYQFRFGAENMSGIGLTAWLEDHFLRTRTVVSLLDSSFIDFTVTTDPLSSAPDRFLLIFNNSTRTPAVPPLIIADAKQSAKGPVNPDITSERIAVSPNPVVNKIIRLNFYNKVNGDYQLQLENSSGQIVLENTVTVSGKSFSATVPVSKLPAGYYTIKIKQETGALVLVPVIIE